MDDTEKRIKRLMSLPSLVNWVRHNKRRLDDTIFQLREFANNPPRHSLRPVQKLCAALAYGTCDEEDALNRAEAIAMPAAKVAAREVIPAFSRYLKKSGIEGVIEFDGFQAMYIIGKKPDDAPLLVPVRPTFVGIKNEKLVPVFVIPWVDFKLDGFQKYLLSTIICDAILTQQDFLGSDSEIIAFPRIKGTHTRDQRGWLATQYNLLSQDDLMEQFERYTRALRAVIAELRSE
ncbi:hypothetical protein [Sphingomonas sp.]|uniref:hypothetical protein n=1 Tax=Sphingomonas sp. TaxID=28214 RepID=UPI002ED88C39